MPGHIWYIKWIPYAVYCLDSTCTSSLTCWLMCREVWLVHVRGSSYFYGLSLSDRHIWDILGNSWCCLLVIYNKHTLGGSCSFQINVCAVKLFYLMAVLQEHPLPQPIHRPSWFIHMHTVKSIAVSFLKGISATACSLEIWWIWDSHCMHQETDLP